MFNKKITLSLKQKLWLMKVFIPQLPQTVERMTIELRKFRKKNENYSIKIFFFFGGYEEILPLHIA